ncbi:hypothetical protein V8C86DRAFT_2707404 [Haematococcus lacustris]
MPGLLCACAAYALGRLPALAWFDIPGVLTAVVAPAASCGCVEGLVNEDIPAWSAAPRKRLDPAELLRRTTIRWDVPRQQLVDLLASNNWTAEVCSEPVYSAGAGWRVCLGLGEGTEDEPGVKLDCYGRLVTYADCQGHALGAPLRHGTHLKYTIDKGIKLGHDWSNAWVFGDCGDNSFLDKSLATAADLDPFLEDGCLQITAAFQVVNRARACAVWLSAGPSPPSPAHAYRGWLTCRPPSCQQSSWCCPAYALGRLPALAWFDIPGALTVVVAQAAGCGCVEGVLDEDIPAWSAAPRKQLDPDELLRRSTIHWDVPRQQLADLLASENLTAKVCSEPVYSAGVGWRVFLNLVKATKDEPGFTLGCWGQVVTYAECGGHALGAKLPRGTHLKYTSDKGRKLGHKWSAAWVMDGWGEPSFLKKSLTTAADLEPFLEDGCLQITAAFQVVHRPRA